MFDIWGFLLQTLTASGAAVLLLVIKALFRDKLPPKWHFAVWGVLGIMLLFPAGLGGRYALFHWQAVIEFIKLAVGDYSFTRVLFPLPVINSIPQTFSEWLFLVYIIGIIVHLIKYFVAYVRLRQLLHKGGSPADETILHIQGIAEKHNIKPCRVIEVSGLPSAFVCGIIRPVLAIPANEEIDDKIILHELFHLKQKDTFWSVVICFFRCLHWCNPLISFCANRAINDLEARCDQCVLEQLEGEERRDYGRILLSMANERFAKTPGSTCINNGGKNIRERIEAIARFKKYPVGMSLVSVCVIIALAFSLVIGVQATEVYNYTNNNSVHLSIASARSTPCTTYAGAFDAYGKAVLEQNGIYRIMCAPEAVQAELADEIIEKSKNGIYPEWDNGLQAWPNTQSGYYIYNLKNPENDVYEGLVVVELNYPPDGQAGEVNKIYVAFQRLRVEKENGRWVAIPLSEFQYVETGDKSLQWGCEDLPSYIYSGTNSNFRVDVQLQTVHMIDSSVQSESDFTFFSESYFDTTPKINASFTSANQCSRKILTHLGTEEERNEISQLGVSVAKVNHGEDNPDDLTSASGGNFSGSSTNGSSWSSTTLKPGWEPTKHLGGGGGSIEPEKDFVLPEYYAADVYVNNRLFTEIKLYLQEEVKE